MSDRLEQFIHEIHRRSLWQVLGIYLVASWAVLSVMDRKGGNLVTHQRARSVSRRWPFSVFRWLPVLLWACSTSGPTVADPPTLAAYGGDAGSGRTRARAGAVEIARWTAELRGAMQAHPGHTTLMTQLRHAAFTDDGALLFVHAGLDASRPLDAQSDALWWGGSGFDAISEPYGGFRMVVRGFDRAGGGLKIDRFTATLDDGCGLGGPLHAGCFDLSGQLVDLLEG